MNACNCPEETTSASERDETVILPRHTTTEDANGATLHVALPGVTRDEVRLTLHESSLRIEARRAGVVPENWKTHRDNGTPRRYGLDIRLTRRFDGSRTTATLDAGVLTLKVPVREESKPRQIEVN